MSWAKLIINWKQRPLFKFNAILFEWCCKMGGGLLLMAISFSICETFYIEPNFHSLNSFRLAYLFYLICVNAWAIYITHNCQNKLSILASTKGVTEIEIHELKRIPFYHSSIMLRIFIVCMVLGGFFEFKLRNDKLVRVEKNLLERKLGSDKFE